MKMVSNRKAKFQRNTEVLETFPLLLLIAAVDCEEGISEIGKNNHDKFNLSTDQGSWEIIPLPDPAGDGSCSDFLFKNNCIFELHDCRRTNASTSCFIGNWVQSDGSVKLVTRIDPLFFVVAILSRAGGCSRYLRLADVCDISSELSDTTFDDQSKTKIPDNELHRRMEANKNIKRIIFRLPDVHQRIHEICDVQEIVTAPTHKGFKEKEILDSNFCVPLDEYSFLHDYVFRLHLEKLITFLTLKVTHMLQVISKKHLFLQDCWKCPDYTAGNKWSNFSHMAKQQAESFCWSLISLYIPGELENKLSLKEKMAKYDVNVTEENNKSCEHKNDVFVCSKRKTTFKRGKSDLTQNTPLITSFFKKVE